MSSPRGEFPLIQLNVDTGITDRTYGAQFPFGIKITRSYLSCAAANATDKVTVTITSGGTNLKTTSTAVANDIIYENIGCDVGKTDFIPAHTPISITFSYLGAAGNVKGIRFTLMGAVKL